jgi:hypothetical protein
MGIRARVNREGGPTSVRAELNLDGPPAGDRCTQ